MKVYCDDCKWFYNLSGYEQCEHPTNIEYNILGREICKNTIYKINKNCKCKYYHRKWWKFWVKK